MRTRTLSLTLLLFFAAACAPEEEGYSQISPNATATATDEEGFTPLFDGETLEGWQQSTAEMPESQLGGKWVAEDGAIVGDQDPPGHGGFLITTDTYRDYVLKMETQLDYPVDSGIFLRMGEDGKSHQVTLDYRPDGNIGDIYLPWTQGMVEENPEGEQHFNEGEWNDVEVRIEGEPAHIQFWVNGEKVTDYQHTAETTEGVPEEGYIALQVHPGESYQAGNKVRFRNIRIKPLD